MSWIYSNVLLAIALLAWILIEPGVVGAERVEPEVIAFPGAEGYGRFSTGGRGGDVYAVTNLEDSGPGSLREGIVSARGPRTIVFRVGGTIELKTPLKIRHSGLTLAGQTAPGEGITLKDQTLVLEDADNIVIRHLRVRLGDKNKGPKAGPDAITVNDCDRVILDHVSASWGIDGIQDIRRCKNYTLQWCIFSEALNDSIHPKGPHAMCASFRAPLGNITIHHNIFATSRDRHPTIGGSVQDPQWIIDFRNNLIYNWSGAANVCDNQVNLINNYFRPGPESDPKRLPIAMKASLPDKARGHMSGNFFEGRNDLTENNYLALDFERWLGPESNYKYAGTIQDWKVEEAYDLGADTPETDSALEAYEQVLERAGAAHPRDSVDKRLIEDIRNRKGRLIDSQDEVGGWPELVGGAPPTDSDSDGMPDEWETAQGLDPADPTDRNGDSDTDGFTNLEEYLHSLAPL
ncbi:MAG: pectate lyase [Candidatus Omnitrophica bacterium]|nr:pectate lyase [Candidatus Omnitrophota bacterium]